MKKIKQFLALGLTVAVVFTSCTMEKRVYMPGYHMEWKKGTQTTAKQTGTPSKKQHIAPMLSVTATEVSGQTAASNEVLTASVEKNIAMNITSAKSLNLVRKAALLSKMNSKEVKYLVKSAVKKNKEATSKDGGKSQLIALLLCFFFGGLGIHRFYLGYMTEGIIQLLTAGGCGIWALIDLIRIITGDLKPKDGSYEKTL